MQAKKISARLPYREVLFQIVLHLVVFTFYSFDRNEPKIEAEQVWYFLSYAAAAFLINYILLPRYFYQKKYLAFVIGLVIIAALTIAAEELVLEKIFYPDTRYQNFPGIFYTLLGVIPIITVLSGFKFAWDALVKQRQLEELKAMAEESELQFLKTQINPHFLFNNLNNLYAYAIEGSPKTPEIILELSGVLRYMLYECKEKYVPLKKEVEQLQNFTQLSQLQIEERGSISFTHDPVPPNWQIAPLILVVFIENAFKHSQSSQSKDIEIDIRLQLSSRGQLDFYCTNSFRPVANNTSLAKGIGLANVKKRLQLLYPDAHQLRINATDTEYQVHLSLQLSSKAAV